MVNLAQAVAGAAVGWAVTKQLDKTAENATDMDESDPNVQRGRTRNRASNRADTDTGRLYEIERHNRPSEESIEGWVGTSFELSPGQTATVEITPTDGFNDRIRRLEFTREDNHDYSLRIAGTEVSSSHKYVGKPPRTVERQQKIVCEVTNNTSSTDTTIDFEAEVWGEPVDGGRW